MPAIFRALAPHHEMLEVLAIVVLAITTTAAVLVRIQPGPASALALAMILLFSSTALPFLRPGTGVTKAA